MLVIYDENGQIYYKGYNSNNVSNLKTISIDVPEGKYFKGIDVSVDPPEPIFEDIPKSELDLMKEELLNSNKQINDLQLALIELYETML